MFIQQVLVFDPAKHAKPTRYVKQEDNLRLQEVLPCDMQPLGYVGGLNLILLISFSRTPTSPECTRSKLYCTLASQCFLTGPARMVLLKRNLGIVFFFSQGAATLKKVEALPKGNIRFVQGWQYCTISKGVKTPCH